MLLLKSLLQELYIVETFETPLDQTVWNVIVDVKRFEVGDDVPAHVPEEQQKRAGQKKNNWDRICLI